jgi:hypothetical protein
MRGPLESLICAKLGKTDSKSASPIAFCRAVPRFPKCMWDASLGSFKKNDRRPLNSLSTKHLAELRILLGECLLWRPAPNAIRLDSGPYPFG